MFFDRVQILENMASCHFDRHAMCQLTAKTKRSVIQELTKIFTI